MVRMWYRVWGAAFCVALVSFACGKSEGGAPDAQENSAGSTAGGLAGAGSGGGARAPVSTSGNGPITSGGGGMANGGMTPGTGGISAGTNSRGGSGGTGPGGMQGMGGAETGDAGTGGANPGRLPLDGLRLDTPCGSKLGGNVCLYADRQSDDGMPFSAMLEGTMEGVPGTPYDVTLHIRGVTGMTSVVGGEPGSPENFLTGGTRYPDGTSQPGATYEQWRLTTSSPSQHYYLNAFELANVKRTCVLIDMVETITIDGGATVTLDVYHGNGRQTSNTVDNPPLAPAGIPGSINSGQFIQINVDSVTM